MTYSAVLFIRQTAFRCQLNLTTTSKNTLSINWPFATGRVYKRPKRKALIADTFNASSSLSKGRDVLQTKRVLNLTNCVTGPFVPPHPLTIVPSSIWGSTPEHRNGKRSALHAVIAKTAKILSKMRVLQTLWDFGTLGLRRTLGIILYRRWRLASWAFSSLTSSLRSWLWYSSKR